MRRALAAVALSVLAVLSGGHVLTASATQAQSTIAPKQVVQSFGHDLLVTIPNPPAGKGYTDNYGLTVPDGVEWRLVSVSFNLTTLPPSTGASSPRRIKWVVRDPADLVNPGRFFSVCTDGLGDYVYKDFSLATGQNYVPGSLGPGTALAVLRSPTNAGLPDLWVPSGYQWVTTTEGISDRDQFSFFYAVVEEQPA